MSDPTHDPAERLPRIERIWAFLSIDADGSESLVAAKIQGQWTALIGADKAGMELLRPLAKQIAGELAPFGKRVVLARFFGRVDQEAIEP